MTSAISSTPTQKTLARAAGLLYLAIIVCGLFAELYVRSNLFIPGDATTTTRNIIANQGLFRLGFVSDLIMLLCDLTLVVVFYHLLKPISHTLALAAVLTRTVMDAVLASNLLNHFQPLLLLNNAEYLNVFNEAQLQSLVSLSLETHSIGYAIGLVFFALHCLVLGILICKSEIFPKVLGILLSFAFLSYLVDSFAKFLIADYDTANYPFIMLPALIAEVSLCLWLLIKGTKNPTSHSQPTAVLA